MWNTKNQIKFKTAMLKSSFYDYSDTFTFIFVKGTIAITGEGNDAAAKQRHERNKEVAFKNFAPFTDCISEII